MHKQSSPIKPSPMLSSFPNQLPSFSSFLPIKFNNQLNLMNHPAYSTQTNYGVGFYSPELMSHYFVPKTLVADPKYQSCVAAQNSAMAHLQALQASVLQKQCFSNSGLQSTLLYPTNSLSPSFFVPPINSRQFTSGFANFDLKKSSC